MRWAIWTILKRMGLVHVTVARRFRFQLRLFRQPQRQTRVQQVLLFAHPGWWWCEAILFSLTFTFLNIRYSEELFHQFWTTLTFCTCMGHDHRCHVIEGQGRMSRLGLGSLRNAVGETSILNRGQFSSAHSWQCHIRHWNSKQSQICKQIFVF